MCTLTNIRCFHAKKHKIQFYKSCWQTKSNSCSVFLLIKLAHITLHAHGKCRKCNKVVVNGKHFMFVFVVWATFQDAVNEWDAKFLIVSLHVPKRPSWISAKSCTISFIWHWVAPPRAIFGQVIIIIVCICHYRNQSTLIGSNLAKWKPLNWVHFDFVKKVENNENNKSILWFSLACFQKSCCNKHIQQEW